MNNIRQVFPTLFLILLLQFQVNAQVVKESDYQAEGFINEVRNAQDIMYEDVLAFYDELLESQPSVYVMIEKCRFIDTVFFDEVEYYNPKYEDYENCLDDLIVTHGDDPDAKIYYHYNQYEDSSFIILEELTSDFADGSISKPKFLALAYEDLARHYSNEENYGKALAYATDAMSENDTLDLSTLKAELYISLNDFESAEDIMLNHLDSTKTLNLYSKATLFSEIEKYDLALQVFEWLQESDEGWEVSEEIGDLLTKLERYDEARPYLLQASNTYWGKRKALENLYVFDLEHSSPDSVLKSYNELRNEGFWADPFGVFKVQMLLKHGMLDFQARDLLVPLSYIALVVLLLIVPYFWIVPIYAYGRWKYDSIELRETYDNRWLLKHFWFISIVILLASVISEIFVDYPTFVASMNDEYVDYESLESIVLARSMLIFDLVMILGTIFLLRIKDVKNWFRYREEWLKEITMAVGSILVLRYIYNFLFGLTGSTAGIITDVSTGYLEQSIFAVIEHYGSFIAFLSVVIIAPLIEEVQFRGIILGSTSRYIPFWAANVLQAILFGLVHENLSFFPFYFCFGLIAGYLRIKTGGYLAPIVFHVVNNFLAFIVLLLIS